MAGPDCGALLRLFLAHYIRMYCGNRHIEQLELRALQSQPLPFDVAFFVYQRSRELKLEEKASRVAGTMTIEAHMKFDTYKARADRQVLSARENQAELWSELTNSNPSLAKAGDVITETFTSTDTVDSVVVDGQLATVVHGSGTNYTATHNVLDGDANGSADVVISAHDVAGNSIQDHIAGSVTIVGYFTAS